MAARVPTARMDMEVAAVRLFAEHGADNVTVEQIAAEARVTARTFHRHFPHKLDVLFGDEDHQFDAVADHVREQPTTTATWTALGRAMRMTAEDFDRRSDLIRARAVIVQADDALRRREQARVADFVSAIVAALAERDEQGPRAVALSYAAVGVFRAAYEAWLADEHSSFAELIEKVISEIETSVRA